VNVGSSGLGGTQNQPGTQGSSSSTTGGIAASGGQGGRNGGCSGPGSGGAGGSGSVSSAGDVIRGDDGQRGSSQGGAGGLSNGLPSGGRGGDSFSSRGQNGLPGQVIITPAGSAPLAYDDRATTPNNLPVQIDVLANDVKAFAASTLSVSAVTQGANGSVTTNGTTVIYTANAGFVGIDTFTYTLSDGSASDNATVTVNVVAANQPPVANDDFYNAVTGRALRIDAPGVLANDSDLDGNALTAEIVSAPANGTVELNADGSFVYTSRGFFVGTDSFVYRAVAPDGEDTATVNILVGITDAAVYDTPGFVIYTVPDGVTFIQIELWGGGGGGGGGGNGTFCLNNGGGGGGGGGYARDTLWVTPGEMIVVNVGSGGAGGGPGQVGTSGSTSSTSGGIGATGGAGGGAGGCIDPGSGGAGGNGSTSSAGDEIRGQNGQNGIGSQGGMGGLSNGRPSGGRGGNANAAGTAGAAGQVIITPLGNAPVANDDSATTPRNQPVIIDVLANDVKAYAADTLTVSAVTQGANGTVTTNGTTITYAPNAGYVGTDSFSYTVSDGNQTASAGVSVTITNTNTAPVGVNDAYTTDEDTPLSIAAPGVLANDTDADSDALTVTASSAAANGTVTMNADGSFTYTPNPNFNGTDSFTYTVSDGGGETSTATVSLTVNAVNDPPTAANDGYSTDEDTPLSIAAPGVLANDTDTDSDALTVTASSAAANGTVTMNADGAFTYTPNPNFNGTDSFTYTVSDGGGETGTATVSLTVNPVNDPPTVNAGADQTVTAGQTVSLTITYGDVDAGDAHILRVDWGDATPVDETLATGGSITRTYTYAAPGIYTVTATIIDSGSAFASDTATITVQTASVSPFSVDDFVVLGLESILLRSETQVYGGDIGANAASAGLSGTGVEVLLERNVHIRNPVSRLAGDTLVLRSNTRVFDVFYNTITLSRGARVNGSRVTPVALPLVTDLPTMPAFTPGTTNIELRANRTLTLPPGDYGTLVTRRDSLLVLTGGVYNFASWEIGSDARVRVLAPTEIRIAGTLLMNSESRLAPDNGRGMSGRDVRIYVNGEDSGNAAVRLGRESLVQASIYAPRGTIQSNAELVVRGALIGRHVVVNRDARLYHESGFGSAASAPVANPDMPLANGLPAVPPPPVEPTLPSAPIVVTEVLPTLPTDAPTAMPTEAPVVTEAPPEIPVEPTLVPTDVPTEMTTEIPTEVPIVTEAPPEAEAAEAAAE
jgi:VCBS repeat-containing protein